METAAIITAVIGGMIGIISGLETVWSRVFKARTEERSKRNAEKLSELELVIEEYKRLLKEANDHINSNDTRLDSIEVKEKECYQRVLRQQKVIRGLVKRNRELRDGNVRQAAEIRELRQHLNLPDTVKGL